MSLNNDSKASYQFTGMLKELNLSPENVPIWYVDLVIFSISDSWVRCLKKKKKDKKKEEK